MSLRPFIKTHVKAILSNFDLNKGSFDVFLRDYYKSNKTLGPSERAVISQTTFTIMKHDLLLKHFAHDNLDRKVDLVPQVGELQQDESLPL